MKKYHIITFGCQMNEHDSEIIAGMLEEKGLVPCDDRKEADVVIINTCSIRENADKRFFGTLGQLKHKHEADPDYIVGVCGCMMQQEHITDTLKAKYPWVDIIFGTHNIHNLPKLLDDAMDTRKRQMEILPDREEIVEGLPSKRLYRHKAFVNIMYGCNNFCTYCIVPYTRGREKSRKPKDILAEVRALVADGVKEITVLGQNVNSYNGGDGYDFTDLIYALNGIEGLERIRFMTSHPKDLSDRLIQAFVDCDKLCNNIHLPVQSGSSRVLNVMNRRYDRERYLDLVRKLKEAVPEITMSTDIIVGFPGETEEDFEDTLSLCEEVGYDSAFTFLYSIRKGTPAEKMEDQIPEDIKHARFERLVDVINESAAAKNAACVGKTFKVLVDGVSKNDMFTCSGRTEGFKLVNFKAKNSQAGEMVDVRITGANTFSLVGEIVE